MSASVHKRPLWSRLVGLFKAPEEQPVAVAAHLQSLTPEAAARLMGPGSVPPRTVPAKIAVAVSAAPDSKIKDTDAADSLQKATVKEDVSRVLPWPLLRTTGAYQAEYSKTDRALALCTADLVEQLDSPASDTTKAVSATRNLAGQLAVVARFNQPKSRAAGLASVKATAIKSQVKKYQAQSSKSSVRSGLSSSAKTKSDALGRPQAIVIDFASVKKQRRSGSAKRAA